MKYNRRGLFGTVAQACAKYNIERSDVTFIGDGAALYYGMVEGIDEITVSLNGTTFDHLVRDNNLEPTLIPRLGELQSLYVVDLCGVKFQRGMIGDDFACKSHRHFKIQSKEKLLHSRNAKVTIQHFLNTDKQTNKEHNHEYI